MIARMATEGGSTAENRKMKERQMAGTARRDLQL